MRFFTWFGEFLKSDPVRRSWRTFAQAFIGIFLLSFTPSALAGEIIPDLSVILEVLRVALWAGVIAVVTLIHNELESKDVVHDTRDAGVGEHPR
jgi:hypothetical protein